jgi:hypothetical protein
MEAESFESDQKAEGVEYDDEQGMSGEENECQKHYRERTRDEEEGDAA